MGAQETDGREETPELLVLARGGLKSIAAQTNSSRVELPLRYLRQQAHLTAPASDYKLAEKALGGAFGVAARLMDRYGLNSVSVGERLGVSASVVEETLAVSGAPVVILDLEDGVAPHLIAMARENAVRLVRETVRGSSLCFLRPSGVGDPRCADDLVTLLIEAGRGLSPDSYPVDGIVFPKVRHTHEVEWLDSVLISIEDSLGLPRNRIRVSYQIETGWGLINLPDLVRVGLHRLSGLILGTVDLGADLLLPQIRYRHPISEAARIALVIAGGAVGVPAIDGMTLDFPVARPDLEPAANRSLLLDRMSANFKDAEHSIDIGMSGRWVGHPLQLLATMLAFRSAFRDAVIEEQVKNLEAFANAMDDDKGAIAGSSGELLDIGTDRHLRNILRRAVAWGLLPPARALQLGLIDRREVEAVPK